LHLPFGGAQIDWAYYRERLSKTIQKIITIPAALQRVTNPVPRVAHPDWLVNVVREQSHAQTKISDVFFKLGRGQVYRSPESVSLGDVEDLGSTDKSKGKGRALAVVTKRKQLLAGGEGDGGDGSMEDDGDDAVEAVAAAGKCPDRAGDFQGWLAHRKTQWRRMRTEKAAARAAAARAAGGRGGGVSGSAAVHAAAATAAAAREAAAAAAAATGGGGAVGKPSRGLGVAELVASAARGVTHGVWQVVEVVATETPGSFVVWAMTSAKVLQRIPIEVPKVLYINCRVGGQWDADFVKFVKTNNAKKVCKLRGPGSRLWS